jgi:hypothetical protein
MAWMLFAIVMVCTLDPDQVVEPLGLLPGRVPVSGAAVATVAPKTRQRTAEARRKSFLIAVANHSVAIALTAAFVLPAVLRGDDVADDAAAGAHPRSDPASLPVAQLHRHLPRGADLPVRLEHRSSTRASRRSA